MRRRCVSLGYKGGKIVYQCNEKAINIEWQLVNLGSAMAGKKDFEEVKNVSRIFSSKHDACFPAWCKLMYLFMFSGNWLFPSPILQGRQ